MSKFDNAMSRQVESLPELIEQQYEDLEPKARTVLSFQEIFNIQRIVLTGCGDSYAAAMATKHAFEMLTSIPTEVVPAIELSRFYKKEGESQAWREITKSEQTLLWKQPNASQKKT